MSRLTRTTRGTALTMTMLLAAACDSDPAPVPDMPELPHEAIGVVVVGPATLPFGNDTDHTSVFTFDEQGTATGRIEGAAAYASRVVSWNRGFTAATANAVFTLTATGRTDVPIDENMVEGAASDPRTGHTMFWFNTARPDGPHVPYRNNYVITAPDQPAVTGSVPGMMLTGSFCGNRVYGTVAGFDALTAATPTVSHQLYELPGGGEESVLRGQWEYPADFRPISRTDACAPDGSAFYNLYGSVEARRGRTAQSGLTLIRTDTATGTRTETTINVGEHPGTARTNTLTVVDDRLYWISADGAVLSLPLDGSREAHEGWTLPANGEGHQVTITGTTVAHIDLRDTPTYTEHDLITGQRTRGPIELPWLKSVVGATTESRKTHYTVTGVAGLPR